jgi:hypothetical protein
MVQGNRRIDRVLDASYVADLASLSLDDLRARRREVEQEETDLSYLRRLLQGRLDILRAELDRRQSGGRDLVDALPQILADDAAGSPHGLGRHIAVEPSRADAHRRHVEALLADVDLSNPQSHDDASLRRVLDTLEAEEARVSQSRRAVQQVMDALSAEVTRRYRDGDADPSDLLPTGA